MQEITAISSESLILALLGTGTVSTVAGTIFGYLLFRRRHTAEADKTEAEVEKLDLENTEEELNLTSKMRQIATEAAKQEAALERERSSHERDNQNNEFLLRLKNATISDQKEDMAELRKNFCAIELQMEALRVTEQQCKSKLEELEKFQKEQIAQNKDVAKYADRAAQLTALIHKAHERGFLQDSELNDAKVGYGSEQAV